MTILKVAGIVLASAAGLGLIIAVLILVTRVDLVASYARSRFELTVKIWGFKIELYPRCKTMDGTRKKSVKAETATKGKKEKKQKKKTKRREGKELTEYLDFVEPALDALKRVVSSIFVKRFAFTFVAAGEDDPAGAALQYGKVWSIAGAAIPIMENCPNVKSYSIDIRVDFDANKPTIEFFTRLRAVMWRFVLIAVIFLRDINRIKHEKRKQK